MGEADPPRPVRGGQLMMLRFVDADALTGLSLSLSSGCADPVSIVLGGGAR